MLPPANTRCEWSMNWQETEHVTAVPMSVSALRAATTVTDPVPRLMVPPPRMNAPFVVRAFAPIDRLMFGWIVRLLTLNVPFMAIEMGLVAESATSCVLRGTPSGFQFAASPQL